LNPKKKNEPMAIEITDIKITADDRKKYPHRTESNIRSIKFVESLSNDDLLDMANNGGKRFEEVLDALGEKTNPRWLQARLAEIAYNRNLIDDQTFDRLSEQKPKY